MGRGNYWPTSQIPTAMIYVDQSDWGWRDHDEQGKPLEERQFDRDLYDIDEEDFLSELRNVLPKSFIWKYDGRDSERRLDFNEHPVIVASNDLVDVVYADNEHSKAIIIAERASLSEYGESQRLIPLAQHYVNVHSQPIFDKLYDIMPNSVRIRTSAWTSAPYQKEGQQPLHLDKTH